MLQLFWTCACRQETVCISSRAIAKGSIRFPSTISGAYASAFYPMAYTMLRFAITTREELTMNDDMIIVSREPIHPGEFLREEYMADRNEVWETLNDYDDEE